ncbi:hypothetical protein C1T31_13510 [Hanstruepera neustonica]|uniref:Uncharacterized protein n=1 Tax=Hanstruepera neustonica TaxID=1445657 RepID=A0A2K1DVQ2_9FLAO|nr:hypothetical protein [Hanstruepera neustonica]PNQ72116.1 hypothetical protein C1T31_13510 [Hanstruepera neustonica]
MNRICIYTQDVIFLTGRSESYARDLLRDIRLLHKKERFQVVTITEFCDYLGLPYDTVYKSINGIHDP